MNPDLHDGWLRINYDGPDIAQIFIEATGTGWQPAYLDYRSGRRIAQIRWEGDRLRVTLASAGHPGPAVVRPDGRVDLLSCGGLPLGLFPDSDPQTEELELGEDDLLFFYSDGVTDARSPDMRYFEDSLADELAGLAGRSAAETARMVQTLVSSFSQDDLRDDMTILVAKVKARPETTT